jgi:hypothetical protein
MPPPTKPAPAPTVSPLKHGAELVAKLKESHTPDHLLEPARKCLSDIHAKEKRIATPKEVLTAIEEHFAQWESETGAPHGTVTKARHIYATGDVPQAAPPPEQAIPIEMQLAEQAATAASMQLASDASK